MRFQVRSTTFAALVLSLTLIACASNSSNADESNADETSAATTATQQEPAVDTGKPIRIAQGQRTEITEYLAEGRITVFDFMSDYCPPCVQIAPWLDRLHTERDDVHVVKVDVNRPDKKGIDWGSPVLRQYGIRSIPHFKIYGADGELMDEGRPAYETIVSWMKQLPQEEKSGR